VKTASTGRARPWLALTATALAYALSGGSAELQSSCALTPDAIARFELWRLWTGHWVHFNAAHLRGDLIAFFVWAALLESESRAVLWRVLGAAAPLLSLAVLLSCPSLAEYRGLSGLDCSLLVALVLLRGVASPRLRGVAWLGLACFGAKCGYELLSGYAILAPDLGKGVQLLPSAHLLGALGGVLVTWKVPDHRTTARRELALPL
jgi:rhomboid family GlyGly-CTERM serine protease